jgi:hypothetical protein
MAMVGVPLGYSLPPIFPANLSGPPALSKDCNRQRDSSWNAFSLIPANTLDCLQYWDIRVANVIRFKFNVLPV